MIAHILFLIKFSLLFPLWAVSTTAQTIKYEDLGQLIKQGNKKVASANYELQSRKDKEGHLARSFIPKIQAKVGQEEFHSDALGDQSSTFYGLSLTANLYNGSTDRREDEKRSIDTSLMKVSKSKSLAEALFLARKSYLELAKAKAMKEVLHDSMERLERLTPQVRRKVQSGVITKSALTSLHLAQAEIEENKRQGQRSIFLSLANLKTHLAKPNLTLSEIDTSSLKIDKKGDSSPKLNRKSFLVKDALLRSTYFETENKLLSGKRLPSLDFFASYGLLPFSERENVNEDDRKEWKAGVQITWDIGEIWENKKLAQSSRSQAQSSKALSQFYEEETRTLVEALKAKQSSLLESLLDLEKELKMSTVYLKQISAEYLRGVKSTSDLTSALNGLLKLKKHRLEIAVQYRWAFAEIDRIMGE